MEGRVADVVGGVEAQRGPGEEGEDGGQVAGPRRVVEGRVAQVVGRVDLHAVPHQQLLHVVGTPGCASSPRHPDTTRKVSVGALVGSLARTHAQRTHRRATQPYQPYQPPPHPHPPPIVAVGLGHNVIFLYLERNIIDIFPHSNKLFLLGLLYTFSGKEQGLVEAHGGFPTGCLRLHCKF